MLPRGTLPQDVVGTLLICMAPAGTLALGFIIFSSFSAYGPNHVVALLSAERCMKYWTAGSQASPHTISVPGAPSWASCYLQNNQSCADWALWVWDKQGLVVQEGLILEWDPRLYCHGELICNLSRYVAIFPSSDIDQAICSIIEHHPDANLDRLIIWDGHMQ